MIFAFIKQIKIAIDSMYCTFTAIMIYKRLRHVYCERNYYLVILYFKKTDFHLVASFIKNFTDNETFAFFRTMNELYAKAEVLLT